MLDSGLAALRGCYSSGALGDSVESRHDCEAEAREDTVPGSSHYFIFAGVPTYCCPCIRIKVPVTALLFDDFWKI